MFDILLTQNQTFIFQYIVWLLGMIMNGIFEFLNAISVPNIGLAIILFTIVMYMLLTPLTLKQQKFSKLSAKMNPEIQEVQKKYKGKKDQKSMMSMNEETQAIYRKYGVSPSGSCVQLLIQMPVLFALYRVIYSMPAYVTKIKDVFMPLVTKLGENDIVFFKEKISSYTYYAKQFGNTAKYDLNNSFIDVLNRASSKDWSNLLEQYPNLTTEITEANTKLLHFNNFLGLNIADSPSSIVNEAIASGKWFLLIGAIMIPLLSAITQWVSVKLMPQPAASTNGEPNQMGSTMKVMNNIMPIMSAFFCYTLPAGMGIYWIAGAVVRTIQQIIINKHIDKTDIDELIKANLAKTNKKRAKMGLPPQQVNTNANINTRKVNNSVKAIEKSKEEIETEVKRSTDYYNKDAKPGSIASKANMVKQFNEKNNK